MPRVFFHKIWLLNIIKFFMKLSLMLSVIYIATCSFELIENSTKAEMVRVYNTAVNLTNVVVHLDLKGFPPKFGYLKNLIPKLQELRVTGFLIEYEDMFPYEGRLVNLSAKYAYKKTELQEFLKMLANLGFDIIPLVQTFGHMEYVLKFKEFKHLRELSLYSNVICPSKPESRILIRNMLEQVITFHRNNFPLKYFHIGCDEVYHINKCKQCLQRSQTDANIFLNHVKATTDFIKTISPNTAVLIWDDMFRSISEDEFKHFKHLRVEPVYWEYSPKAQVQTLFNYHKKFKNIWIASAFKGADGIIAKVPNLKKRYLNHLSWMEVIQTYIVDEKHNNNFKGIILTGWSRYFHMAPPCELLPVSIPSLFLNLLLIKKFNGGYNWTESVDASDFFNKNLLEDFSALLHCNKLMDIDNFDIDQCYFDGLDLMNHSKISKIMNHCDKVTAGILNTVSDIILENVTNARYIDDENNTPNKLKYLEDEMKKILSKYYEDNFVTQYVNYKLKAMPCELSTDAFAE